MKLLIAPVICLLVLQMSSVIANEMVLDLRGFRIGQYRDVPRNVLGEPMKKEKFDDGFESEIYLIKPDTSVYMIFEYLPGDLQIIWSIQLTGKGYESNFKNMILGAEQSKVVEVLGEPTRKVDIGRYGQRWEYEGTNYSIEINARGKLSSIKIKDESSRLFPKMEVNKIPAFSHVIEVLKSNDPNKINELLCPDLEISRGGVTYFFKSSLKNELNSDVSGIFKLIAGLSADLEKIDTKNTDEYVENLRLSYGHDPLHVIKIKKGTGAREIVLKYRFGKFLIWEIKS